MDWWIDGLVIQAERQNYVERGRQENLKDRKWGLETAKTIASKITRRQKHL